MHTTLHTHKSRASPKCYECPKKHIGPTIWFHSIKLKLFKLIFINRFNDLFLLFPEMTVLRNQNKAREEPESWILKSFNLIEWNQIVGPVCFLTFGRRSALNSHFRISGCIKWVNHTTLRTTVLKCLLQRKSLISQAAV